MFSSLSYVSLPPPNLPCRFILSIDATNTGEWVECASVENPPLPNDWLSKSYIGLTASTGQLADNHDVIALQSFSDFDVMDEDEETKKTTKLFPVSEGDPVTDRLRR
jgi:hypothetical protein